MSTPAVNDTVKTVSPMSYSYGPPGGPIDGTSTYPTMVSGGTIQERPASVENPIRVDGTRNMSPWHHRWAVVHNPAGAMTVVNRYGTYQYHSDNFHGPDLTNLEGMCNSVMPWFTGGSGFPVSVENAALIKFLKKIRGNDFSLGVSLGESRETIGLVNSSLKRLVGDIKFFKRQHKLDDVDFKRFLQLNSRSPRTSWKQIFRDAVQKNTVVASWLEYNYGWKPLVRDVVSASKALNQIVNEEQRALEFSCKAGFSSVETRRIVNAYVPFGGSIVGNRDFQVTSSCHFSGRFKLPSGTLQDFTTLGLDNPLEVAWELVRLSFVVDWFVGVGEWLSVLSVPISMNLYAEQQISKSRVQRAVPSSDWVFSSQDPWMWSVKKQPKGNGNWEIGRMDREILYSLPSPMFPRLNGRLGLDQLATGLSLLTQMVR